jgi:photosystem II stability/assembly factor-like uncharacterized protein
VSQQEGWAVGDGHLLAHTQDAGDHWEFETIPGTDYCSQVAFLDADHGWIGGGHGRLRRMANGGATWVEQRIPRDLGVSHVDPVSTTELWVTLAGWTGNTATDTSVILHSTNSGLTWETQYEEAGIRLNDIEMTTPHDGWAVGSSGLALRTLDGGAHWNPVDIAQGMYNFSDINFSDPRHGWLVGPTALREFSWIGRTTNGGDTWDELAVPDARVTEVYRIAFADSLHGWLLGSGDEVDYVFATSDGGETWNPTTCEASEYLDDLCAVNDSLAWLVGQSGTIMRYGAPRPEPDAALDLPPISQNFALSAWPNPFNSTARIRYDLDRATVVTIDILNVLGERVTTLANGPMNAGRHEITWNASASSSGVYFVTLKSSTRRQVQKIVLMK